MQVTVNGARATVELEDYPDLLIVRTLPEYEFSAIKLGRSAYGIELKESYYRTAQRIIAKAVAKSGEGSLFQLLEPEPVA